jgi:hypothetical protein
VILNPKTKVENKPIAKPISITKEKDFNHLLKGDVVIHKTFGEGIIKYIEGDRIIVAFGKAEKLFAFPDAFIKGYLSI